jgi:hypothetical protein
VYIGGGHNPFKDSSMRSHLLVLSIGFFCIAPAGAQQMDMEAMQRWGSAEVIYYAVEGVHNGEVSVTATMGGFADAVDSISLTFEWSLTEAKLLKLTSLHNSPTQLTNLRDFEKSCLPPVLAGAYEYATVLEVVNGLGGALDMQIERAYPAAEVAQSCTASRKAVPAEKKIAVYSMAVPSPVMMAMGVPSTDTLAFTADKKSMVVKDGNWTWTFTPSTTAPGNQGASE